MLMWKGSEKVLWDIKNLYIFIRETNAIIFGSLRIGNSMICFLSINKK